MDYWGSCIKEKTQYEQEMERLKEMQVDRWDAGFPVGLQNCFRHAGINSKKQLNAYRKAGGDFKRFVGVGEKYEKLILDWLEPAPRYRE